MKQYKAGDKANTINHKFAVSKDGWDFTSEPINPDLLKSFRGEAKSLIKKTKGQAVNMRSCWQCNPAHCHFLADTWKGWVLHCFDCGRFYYRKVDITEYGDYTPPKRKPAQSPDNAFITDEELEEFKAIARKEYGKELTDEQAFEQASALLNLFDHLLRATLEKKRRERLSQKAVK